MKTATEEFISAFHGLDGTTVGERRKNLNLILNRYREGDSSNLDFSELRPRTPLEEIFKVETLIYFKKASDLKETLKSENPILIEKVFKTGSWFFDALETMGTKELVAAFLPFTSFNVKQKMLNKLSSHLKNSQQSDELFKAVQDRYGLYLASKLLPACSSDVIMHNVETYKIKLASTQLLSIIKKYPAITENLFEILSKRVNINEQYKSVVRYLFRQDISLFLKLSKSYNLSLRFGWRTTDKFIRKNKDEVMRDSDVYYRLLHVKQIAKSLRQDFDRFYFNFFPKTLEEFQCSRKTILNILKQLPSNMRDVNLFLTVFKRAYGTDVWDHPSHVTASILKLVSPNEREKIMKAEYKPVGMSEDNWMCYYKTSISMPFFKKRISLTSDIETRAALVGFMVETCQLNEDNAQLTNVCKYVVNRHRNDHIRVRLAFMRNISDCFVLANLEAEHWESINEMIQIFAMNNESFYDQDFLESYIHHRLKNNLSVNEQLRDWVARFNDFNIIKENPAYEKYCLTTFYDIIQEMSKEKDTRRSRVLFLRAINDWNKRHRNDRMPLANYRTAIDAFKSQSVEQCRYNNEINVLYYLQQEVDREEREELLIFFLKRGYRFSRFKTLDCFVRNDPSMLTKNIGDVTKFIIQLDSKSIDIFWRRYKNYSHLNIPDEMIKVCLSEYRKKCKNDRDTNLISENAVKGLSYLMAPGEFSEFIRPFCPVDDRANPAKDDDCKFQRRVCRNLKNVAPVSRTLENVLHFCKGDHLKTALRSLYSICNNANEDKLVSFFDRLSTRPVSVRKHAVHLSYRVLDKTEFRAIINKFMKIEKNPSIRKFLLKCTFNYFIRNPDDYAWELVKLNVRELDVNDKEAFDTLLRVDEIPSRYFMDYFNFVWEILKTLPDQDGTLDEKKSTLLSSLDRDVIVFITTEFFNSVVEQCFLKFDKDDGPSTTVHQSFLSKCIVYCVSREVQEERLQIILPKISNVINDHFHNSKTRSKSRSYVASFIKIFCSEALAADEVGDKSALIKFSDFWNGALQPHEAFDEYLHIRLSLIIFEKVPVAELARDVSKCLDDLLEMYGLAIVEIFYNKMNSLAGYFIKGEKNMYIENLYKFVEMLIECNSSIGSLLLAVMMLGDCDPDPKELKEKHDEIIDGLFKKNDPVLHLYLSRHLRGESVMNYI